MTVEQDSGKGFVGTTAEGRIAWEETGPNRRRRRAGRGEVRPGFPGPLRDLIKGQREAGVLGRAAVETRCAEAEITLPGGRVGVGWQ